MLGFLLIIRDIKVDKTLDYYTVDKFFQNLYDRKKFIKRGRILKKYTISRKQTLTLASVVLGTVFTGTTIASADDVAPATTQAAPTATTATKSPITTATEEINAKANTPVVPADKAKTGDVIAVDVKKTGPSAKTDGADTTTTSTATIKTTKLSRSRHTCGHFQNQSLQLRQLHPQKKQLTTLRQLQKQSIKQL